MTMLESIYKEALAGRTRGHVVVEAQDRLCTVPVALLERHMHVLCDATPGDVAHEIVGELSLRAEYARSEGWWDEEDRLRRSIALWQARRDA